MKEWLTSKIMSLRKFWSNFQSICYESCSHIFSFFLQLCLSSIELFVALTWICQQSLLTSLKFDNIFSGYLRWPVKLYTGADLGGGCRGCAPPPPRDDLRRVAKGAGIRSAVYWGRSLGAIPISWKRGEGGVGVVSSIRSSKLSGKLQRLAVVVLQIQGLKLSSRDETSSYRLSINRISGRN